MIRKPVDKLLPADLLEFPTWEFALDEEHLPDQDETTVRPVAVVGPINPSNGQIIIRANFELTDGTRLTGAIYAKPCGDRIISAVQPVILLDSGPVLFWHGVMKPTKAEIDSYLQALNKTPNEIFPIQYSSDVALVGGAISGVIEGFY